MIKIINKWNKRHKDGHEIQNGTRINVKHANNGASSLFISRTFIDDAGIYQVTATNDYGISVYQAEVTVDRNIKLIFKCLLYKIQVNLNIF